MESLDPPAGFIDDLLDFASDIGEEDDDEETHRANKPRKALASLNPNGPLNVLEPDDGPACSLPEFAEEELEWLSNKDTFPALETCFSIPSEQPSSTPKHHSPVSVLENSSTTSSISNRWKFTNGSIITNSCSSFRVPVKARSKRQYRCRGGPQDQQCWWSKENFATVKPAEKVAKLGRKCQHCGAEKTPQWRAGPLGPKTLCNACGVRFKSGRLVPEYRPASCPSFCSELHSNSHRKVLEMRKQKQMMGLIVVKPMDKG